MRHVDALCKHADGVVTALAVRIVETWETQLEREPRKSAAAKPPPKPKCKACAGQKRQHTCRDKGKAARARVVGMEE